MKSRIRKPRKARKTRKGGVIVRDFLLKPYMSCHIMDCVPSSLYELGLTDMSTAKYLAEGYPRGFGTDELLEILYETYGVVHRYHMYEFTEETKDASLADLKSRLENGEGLLATYNVTSTLGHQFIIFKEDGVLLARDPIQNIILPLDEYLKGEKSTNFYVIFTDKGERVDRNNLQITKSIIDDLKMKGKLPYFKPPRSTHETWKKASRSS